MRRAGPERIIATGDGSASLRIAGTDITYHSRHGALTESLHIFLHTGLHYCWERQPAQQLTQVLEVGFGSGLNAMLTAHSAAEYQRPLRYTTLEPFPLSTDIWRKLNYEGQDQQLLYELHQADWEQDVHINDHFVLHKTRQGIHEFLLDAATAADVVYYDAFAPEDQPELWTPDIFQLLFRSMSPNSALTTYCAKGAIRRSMQAAGFTTQRLEGPPGGKREILRALKWPWSDYLYLV